jgi:hypothetical protein
MIPLLINQSNIFRDFPLPTSFFVLEHIIFETTVQIPDVEFGGKYGYMRANTDICPVLALRANNQQ